MTFELRRRQITRAWKKYRCYTKRGSKYGRLILGKIQLPCPPQQPIPQDWPKVEQVGAGGGVVGTGGGGAGEFTDSDRPTH